MLFRDRLKIFLKLSACLLLPLLIITSTILTGSEVPVLKYLNVFDKSEVYPTNKSIHTIDSNIYTHVHQLTNILETKLKLINITTEVKQLKPTCENNFTRANSCDNNTCLRTELPENLTARVEQLLMPAKLQMSRGDHEILQQMTESINGTYDIILLTAASSNHFTESEALLKNLHENVFPNLKNFSLIFYNIGLTQHERQLMVKYCKCQVIDFPFEKFPNFMKSLTCYSWKPVLIKSSLPKANIVFWADTSVRITNSSVQLNQFIQTTRERGFQIGGTFDDSTFRTSRTMYHFFGDEPCAYLTLGQAMATFGMYHNEYFVDRLILEPWVACAVTEECMCPKNDKVLSCNYSNEIARKYKEGKGPLVYGLCHRFDQSAISLIYHKLYLEKYPWVMILGTSLIRIQRSHRIQYFPRT